MKNEELARFFLEKEGSIDMDKMRYVSPIIAADVEDGLRTLEHKQQSFQKLAPTAGRRRKRSSRSCCKMKLRINQ